MNKVYANFWMTFVATKEKNIAFALSNTANAIINFKTTIDLREIDLLAVMILVSLAQGC